MLRPLAVALAALVLTQSVGCTRFHLQRTARGEDGAPARVVFETYVDDAHRVEGEPFAGKVTVELWRKHGSHWEIVHRGDPDALAGLALPAGKWRVFVTGVEEQGRMVPPAGIADSVFEIEPGQSARVDLTVKSVPWEALIVVTVAVVVVVVVAAVAVSAAGGGDGLGDVLEGLAEVASNVPPPPLPPHPLPPPVVLRALHTMPIDVWIDVGIVLDEDYPEPPPEPARGPHVEEVESTDAGELRVRFTERVDPDDLDPETIPLVGPGGIVPTGVYTPDGGRTAVVHPLTPLSPGRYQLVVDASAITTRDDEVLERGAVKVFAVE